MTARTTALAIAFGAAFAAAPLSQADARPAPAAVTQSSERPADRATSVAPDDASRYAERERSAKPQKSFKGGDGYVVIGGTTIAVVLAIVLLIVLL